MRVGWRARRCETTESGLERWKMMRRTMTRFGCAAAAAVLAATIASTGNAAPKGSAAQILPAGTGLRDAGRVILPDTTIRLAELYRPARSQPPGAARPVEITWNDKFAPAANAAGQRGAAEEARRRFSLFNECRPMRLVVETLPSAAAEIGLTRERIRTMAESRLRAARLFSDNASPYLMSTLTFSDEPFRGPWITVNGSSTV